MFTKIEKNFITPQKAEKLGSNDLVGPNGRLLFTACNSGIEFAGAVKHEYELMLEKNGSPIRSVPLIGTLDKPVTTVFSDTETCARLDMHVAGADTFVFQCAHELQSGRTANENIMEMLQVIRTLRTHRAKNITVINPYSPYSRQDKPTFMKREAAIASLLADLLKTAGCDTYVTYHPHTYALSGFYEPGVKFVALSGLNLFEEIFKEFKESPEAIAVSTDAGGAKFIQHFADAMGISFGISNKFREEKDKTSHIGLIGDFTGKKTAIILDDETVTGSSILNTVRSLHETHGFRDIRAAITHMKCDKNNIKGFVEAHERYSLKELHITDSIPQVPEFHQWDFIRCHSLAKIIAATINRLHYNLSVSDIFKLSESGLT